MRTVVMVVFGSVTALHEPFLNNWLYLINHAIIVFGNSLICGFVLMVRVVSVRGSDVVDYIREKEVAYYPEQSDAKVVQPYAAFGPAGHAKVPPNPVCFHVTLSTASCCLERGKKMKV